MKLLGILSIKMSGRTIAAKRMLWPDAIRAFSVFLVVLIHTSAKVVLSWGNISLFGWMTGNLFDSLARISVPLFVILSGSLLLHKKEGLKTFFQKRAVRIILPWFFWGTILLFFNHFFGFSRFEDQDIKLLLIKNYSGGFWFMPMLVGIYTITPIIKPFVQKAKEVEFKYFFGIWFVVGSLIPTLANIFNLQIGTSLPVWISYLGYFVGGYLITEEIRLDEKMIKWAKVIFSIGFLTVFVGTYKLISTYGHFTNHFYDYMSVPVVLMSFSAFAILKNYFETKKVNEKVIEKIRYYSDNSFGIFLSHILILRFLENGFLGFTFSTLSFHPILSIPLQSVTIFLLSALLISNLKKIPKLRKFAG